jgi:hypothetical protein
MKQRAPGNLPTIRLGRRLLVSRARLMELLGETRGADESRLDVEEAA